MTVLTTSQNYSCCLQLNPINLLMHSAKGIIANTLFPVTSTLNAALFAPTKAILENLALRVGIDTGLFSGSTLFKIAALAITFFLSSALASFIVGAVALPMSIQDAIYLESAIKVSSLVTNIALGIIFSSMICFFSGLCSK